MQREEILLSNFYDVQASLAAACKRVHRDPSSVTLLAVTKYAKDEDVLALLRKHLLQDVAESRVQQAYARWHQNPLFAPFTQVKKHLIGHLQKNKAAKAAVLFDWIDSLDDFETARLLSIHAPQGKILRALVQIKLTDKASQSGLPLAQARRLAARLKGAFANVQICGYMAVAPQGAGESALRRLFGQVADAFKADFQQVPHAQLSLGMSEDFVWAVEEGSTLPRIGSLLFNRNLEGI